MKESATSAITCGNRIFHQNNVLLKRSCLWARSHLFHYNERREKAKYLASQTRPEFSLPFLWQARHARRCIPDAAECVKTI